jgi:hypothetical protein
LLTWGFTGISVIAPFLAVPLENFVGLFDKAFALGDVRPQLDLVGLYLGSLPLSTVGTVL